MTSKSHLAEVDEVAVISADQSEGSGRATGLLLEAAESGADDPGLHCSPDERGRSLAAAAVLQLHRQDAGRIHRALDALRRYPRVTQLAKS